MSTFIYEDDRESFKSVDHSVEQKNLLFNFEGITSENSKFKTSVIDWHSREALLMRIKERVVKLTESTDKNINNSPQSQERRLSITDSSGANTVDTGDLTASWKDSFDSDEDSTSDKNFLGEASTGELYEITELDYTIYTTTKINEILLDKTLRATDLRIACAHMKADMLERQEVAILSAFGAVNMLLARSAYYFGEGKLAVALSFRAKAGFKESYAVREYAKLVLEEATGDAIAACESSLYWCAAWRERLLSNEAVEGETRAAMKNCKGTSAQKVESKWRHHRAKAIMKADQSAFNAAWPTVK